MKVWQHSVPIHNQTVFNSHWALDVRSHWAFALTASAIKDAFFPDSPMAQSLSSLRSSQQGFSWPCYPKMELPGAAHPTQAHPWCYGLDLECPPKAHMFCVSLAWLGGGGAFEMWSLVECFRFLGPCSQKGLWGISLIFFLFHFLSTMRGAVSFNMCSRYRVSSWQAQKQCGQLTLVWNLQNCKPK